MLRSSPVRASDRFDRSQWDSVAIATTVLLAFAFLLGGASRQHELRLALVELAALPTVVLAALALLRQEAFSRHPLAFGILAATAALPLLQLLPLPPALWTALPGRAEPALALELSGITPEWTPLSLTPDRTWRSFLALLPPIAAFLAILAVPVETQRRVMLTILAATVAAVILGAAQLASGGDSLYPWRTTDAGSVVGFFANRNHLATLCLISIPFAAVLGSASLRQGGRAPSAWYAALFIGLMIVALGVIRSRAGIILIWPVLGTSLLAAWVAAGRGRPPLLLLAIAAGVTAALVGVGLFALDPILARFEAGSSPEGRFENWPIVAEAANAYLPIGSGLGSFDSVYRSVEPLARLDATYFNQAHNEYLEIWLETGWLGVAVLAAFLVWFGRRTWTAWGARPSSARDLQRAASIAIGAVLLHSVGDYPLRTETIAVIFALCCGLLELAGRPDAELFGMRAGGRNVRRGTTRSAN